MIARKKKKNLGEIPTASLSDVAFLLLVFFLSTTKFDMKEGLQLVLPKADQEQEEPSSVYDWRIVCYIRIEPSGLIRLQTFNEDGSFKTNEEIYPSDIRFIASNLLLQNPDMTFRVIPERTAKYSRMIEVLEQLQLARVESIQLDQPKGL